MDPPLLSHIGLVAHGLISIHGLTRCQQCIELLHGDFATRKPGEHLACAGADLGLGSTAASQRKHDQQTNSKTHCARDGREAAGESGEPLNLPALGDSPVADAVAGG
jgi:hypothetical protein